MNVTCLYESVTQVHKPIAMKLSMLAAATGLLLLAATTTKAQSKSGAAYFSGTWNVLVKNTPNGDVHMMVVLKNVHDSLSGVVEDSTGAHMADISKTELTDTSATVYFTAQGYDVNLEMDKKGPDHVAGSMMGMFDAIGDRVN